jgi:hypothetical protein
MTRLADDVRRSFPVVGGVSTAWFLLQLVWYASLVWAMSPSGHFAPLFVCQAMALWIAMLAIPAAVTGVPLLFGRRRTLGVVCLLSSVVILTSGRMVGPGLRSAKAQRLRQFAERSQPLVTAIAAYERDSGHPPVNLGMLVPAYLVSIPSTGMGAFPEYIYSPGDGSKGGWRLRVAVGVTEWEALEYHPSEDVSQFTTLSHGWTIDIG